MKLLRIIFFGLLVGNAWSAQSSVDQFERQLAAATPADIATCSAKLVLVKKLIDENLVHPWLYGQVRNFAEGRDILVDWFPHQVYLDFLKKRFSAMPPADLILCLGVSDRVYALLLKYFVCKRVFREYGEPKACLSYAKDRYQAWRRSYKTMVDEIKRTNTEAFEGMRQGAKTRFDALTKKAISDGLVL